eukprot:TRINITY_DN21311_c0_g1_i1.p1 TRINITY_DN21311_c0_g1~~TRINITY_DN21311_c0_g1_i1.p1  ORF type:complete len:935 (+),score=378.97 TRINITY_DN21311_c0_g1_i1:77-2806(+)
MQRGKGMELGARLTGVLLTHAGDPGRASDRDASLAGCALRDAEEADFARYCGGLLSEMSDAGKPDGSRKEAARLLSACLLTRDPPRREAIAEKWVAAPAAVRVQLRNTAALALASPCPATRTAAAHAVAVFARVDLPLGESAELLPHLCAAAGGGGLLEPASDADSHRREGALLAIGHLCDEAELAPDLRTYLTPYVGDLLAPVLAGLRSDAEAVQLTASASLCRMTDLLDGVMSGAAGTAQRDFLIETVFEAADGTAPEALHVDALKFLTKVTANYYADLEPYMQSYLQVGVAGLQAASSSVVLQSAEMWIALCEVEQELLELERVGQHGGVRCRQYILGALQWLVPCAWDLLVLQDETADEEEWGVSAAAAGLVQAVSCSAGDAALLAAMPYVVRNISSTSWREQEAATAMLACVCEGSSRAGQFSTALPEIVPTVLRTMRTDNVMLREATTWALGRIAEFHPTAMSALYLRQSLEVLVGALRDSEPRIAAKATYALYHVAMALGTAEEATQEGANPLSPYFQVVVAALLGASEREDAGRNGLREGVWDTIGACCGAAPSDCLPVLQQLLPLVVARLLAAADDAAQTVQIVPVAATIAKKLRRKDLRPCADGLMKAVVPLCPPSLPQQAGGSAVVPPARPVDADGEPVLTAAAKATAAPSDTDAARLKQEVLLCISAVAGSLGEDFVRYVGSTVPRLVRSLADWTYPKEMRLAAAALRDVMSAATDATAAWGDEIMLAVMRGLRSPQVDRAVKPSLVGLIGTVAMTVGGRFDRYADTAMAVVRAAADAAALADPDLQADTWEECARAYSGLLQGLKHSAAGTLPQRRQVTEYALKLCGEAATQRPGLVAAALELVADICNAYGKEARHALQREPSLRKCLGSAAEASDESVREASRTAAAAIARQRH